MEAVRVIRVGGLLFAAAVLAWLAIRAAALVWHILLPGVELSADVQHDFPALQSDQAQENAAVDLAALQSVYVLRSEPANSSGSWSSASPVADTRLSLSLKGVVLSSDPTQSRAIIASVSFGAQSTDHNASQRVYSTGDSVQDAPGTVRLQAVYQNHVLLDNNGLTETLRMDEPAAATSTAQPNPDAQMRQPQQAVETAGDLTQALRLQAVFEAPDSERAGSVRGLQIRHGSRQDILAALGLRQGDIIVAVNGERLESVEQLPSLRSQLLTAQTQAVTLTLMRDDVEQSLQLN